MSSNQNVSPEKPHDLDPGFYWMSLGGNNEDAIGGNGHTYFAVTEDASGRKKVDTILVDLGSKFANRTTQKCDELLPDISDFLEHRTDDKHKPNQPASALFLTHGHMDHIGAVAHYLNMGYRLPPIYLPPVTYRALMQVLVAQKVPVEYINELTFHLLEPDRTVKVGALEVQPFSVSHSYAQSMGFRIGSDGAKILHMGDFKLDQTCTLGAVTNLKQMEKFGKEGVAAIMADSTGAIKETANPDEATLVGRFTDLFNKRSDRRIIVPVMAQNHQRLPTIAASAAASGRTIVVTGRAIQNSLRALKDAGFDLEAMYKVKIIFDPKAVKAALRKPAKGEPNPRYLDPSKVIVLATGTQGELRANMARAAAGEHPDLILDEKTDIIVRSSIIIPGNERPVEIMYGGFNKQGIETLTEGYHSSGHAPAAELQKLFELVQPKTGIPMHGNVEQLAAHGGLIRAAKSKPLILASNGQLVRITKNGAQKHYAARRADRWIAVFQLGTFFAPNYRYTAHVDGLGRPLFGEAAKELVKPVPTATAPVVKTAKPPKAKKPEAKPYVPRKNGNGFVGGWF